MILSAQHINKYFLNPEKHRVLHNISLDIYNAELVSIYGSSGSGKSTLLYILSTLDTDFEGMLSINGTNTLTLPKKQLPYFRNENIGFVYQSHYLLNEFNVLQNVMLPALKLAKKSIEIIKEEALQLLDELEMKSFAIRKPYKLSGGQQQRVAIARALINNPLLIIADEPTGNLDQKNSELIFGLLKNIAKIKKKSVIMTTHNPTLYKKSHRAIEMINGSLRL